MGRVHRVLIFNVIITFTMSTYSYLYYVRECVWYQHVVFILMAGWFFKRIFVYGPFFDIKRALKRVDLKLISNPWWVELVNCEYVMVTRCARSQVTRLTFEYVWFGLVIFDTCCSDRVRCVFDYLCWNQLRCRSVGHLWACTLGVGWIYHKSQCDWQVRITLVFWN